MAKLCASIYLLLLVCISGIYVQKTRIVVGHALVCGFEFRNRNVQISLINVTRLKSHLFPGKAMAQLD
jgi:hypothetical protein